MKCPFKICTNHTDCAILDITKKVPESFDKCSYSKTQAQLEKLLKKKVLFVDPKEAKKLRREAKKESKNEG